MLNWMYWPHETEDLIGERREAKGSQLAGQQNEVLELSLVEEELGTDPYNRTGPLTRPKRIRML